VSRCASHRDVAVSDNERRWLELGRGKTVRQLEDLVAGKHLGEDPDSPADSSIQRRVLRFEVEAETFACFREAIAELRRRSGAPVDDDSALLEMSRLVLAGPRDEGRSSYQVVLSVCPVCGAGRQAGGGELVPVGTEIVGMACCDAQHVGHIAGNTDSAMHGTLSEPRAEHTNAAAERVAPANQNAGTQSEPDETHANAHVGRAVSTRAGQSIPPALRRAVLLRDQHRCRVPGCRHASYLDLHHIELRSEGGSNSVENILSVCSSHHRALHRGELVVEGTASAPAFRHADGAAYGQRTEPSAADAQSKTFQALRGLGFREAEIRAVLVELRQDATLKGAPVQRLLRVAQHQVWRYRLVDGLPIAAGPGRGRVRI